MSQYKLRTNTNTELGANQLREEQQHRNGSQYNLRKNSNN